MGLWRVLLSSCFCNGEDTQKAEGWSYNTPTVELLFLMLCSKERSDAAEAQLAVCDHD